MQELVEAYEILGDPVQRKKYDVYRAREVLTTKKSKRKVKEQKRKKKSKRREEKQKNI